jgi:FtsZ-binding cell division protein ZapB
MSHNPFSYMYPASSMQPFTLPDQRSKLPTSPDTIDLEQLSEFKELKAEVERLKQVTDSQRAAIEMLAEEITKLRQNNSGQRQQPDAGYWQETRW